MYVEKLKERDEYEMKNLNEYERIFPPMDKNDENRYSKFMTVAKDFIHE